MLRRASGQFLCFVDLAEPNESQWQTVEPIALKPRITDFARERNRSPVRIYRLLKLQSLT